MTIFKITLPRTYLDFYFELILESTIGTYHNRHQG